MTALRITIAAAFFVAGVVVGFSDPPTAAQDVHYFRIGTGSTAGTYFPVGEALAILISHPAGAPLCDDGGRC